MYMLNFNTSMTISAPRIILASLVRFPLTNVTRSLSLRRKKQIITKINYRLVFTNEGFGVGVVIRTVELYDLVKTAF